VDIVKLTEAERDHFRGSILGTYFRRIICWRADGAGECFAGDVVYGAACGSAWAAHLLERVGLGNGGVYAGEDVAGTAAAGGGGAGVGEPSGAGAGG